jgi:hypothetical protein
MDKRMNNMELLRRIAPRVLVSVVAPILVYQLIRSSVDSDVIALAIGAAVPVVWTLGRFALTRKVDPVGVVSTVGFAIGITVAWLSGGSPLALELRDAVPTGLLGLVCVVSVLVRRPLHLVVLRLLAKRNPAVAKLPSAHTASLTTALLGVTLLVHAAALTVLALNVPVSTYVGLSKLVGWTIIGAGLAVIFWYGRRNAAIGKPVTSGYPIGARNE